jgi:hypothetical protein
MLIAFTPFSPILGALHQFLDLPVLFWIEAMNLLKQRGRCEGMLREAQKRVIELKVCHNSQSLRRELRFCTGAGMAGQRLSGRCRFCLALQWKWRCFVHSAPIHLIPRHISKRFKPMSNLEKALHRYSQIRQRSWSELSRAAVGFHGRKRCARVRTFAGWR